MAAPMPLDSIRCISSKRLTLRPVEEVDLDDLLDTNGDSEVTRFLPYATWQSRDDGLAWLRRMETLATSGTSRQLVLARNTDAKVIGTLLLFRYDEPSARLEVGYALGRDHWGKGLMAEALEAICDHAFSTLSIRRMEAEVNPSNIASNRLMQRIGFTLEGVLRKRWVAKGVAYDSNFYGCLAEDWRSNENAA